MSTSRSGGAPPAHPLPSINPDDITNLFGPGSDDSGYDPKAFYTRASDEFGHSGYVRSKIHPDQIALITRMLQSGHLANTPLDTVGAFVRDAVTHRIWQVASFINDPEFVAAAQAMAAHSAVTSLAARHDERRRFVAESKKGFEEFRLAGDSVSVRELIAALESRVEHEREPFRGQIITLIEESTRWLGSY